MLATKTSSYKNCIMKGLEAPKTQQKKRPKRWDGSHAGTRTQARVAVRGGATGIAVATSLRAPEMRDGAQKS